MSRIVSFLYRLARTTRDVEVASSVDPGKIGRRLINKRIGRHLGRLFLRKRRR